MFRIRSRFVLVMAIAGLLWIPASSSAQDSQILAQVPPGQAVIAYDSDELAIAAQSSPLMDVLQEACRQMGAELDAPADATELTTGFFGPGPARDVLVSLLKATSYELGTAGSVDGSKAILKVVVLRKSKDSVERARENPTVFNSKSDPVPQPVANSTLAGEKASVQEMVELLSEAKASFVDNEAEPEEPQTELVRVQTEPIFKALEALVRANAAAEVSGANPPTSPKRNDAGSLPPAIIRRRR